MRFRYLWLAIPLLTMLNTLARLPSAPPAMSTEPVTLCDSLCPCHYPVDLHTFSGCPDVIVHEIWGLK